MTVRIETVLLGVLCAALLVAPEAAARNLHLIEQDAESGFALYRTGKPSAEELRRLCKDLGIQQIAVLSGNQEAHEAAYRAACPDGSLQVVYDHRQRVECGLTSRFLEEFDRWIGETRNTGGRSPSAATAAATGRDAGGVLPDEAPRPLGRRRAVRHEGKGEYMWWFMPRLRPQVLALESYIDGVPCELEGMQRKYCVDAEGPGTEACAEARRITRICWDEGAPASACGLEAGGG